MVYRKLKITSVEIIPYEEQYYDELSVFSRKIWPHKPEEYLKYRLIRIPAQASDTDVNLLILNDAGQIVGCNLFFPTRAMIDGVPVDIAWSHDTFVEKEYRGDAGIELTLRVNSVKNMFGKGLSEINYKILKKIKINFLTLAGVYWVFNRWAFKLVLYKFGILKPQRTFEIEAPEAVRVCGARFKRVKQVDELKIPNNGFWNAEDVRVDFVRDRHFLQERFFGNFNRYYLYRRVPEKDTHADDCYFVVRTVLVRNYPILSLVDFRYDLKFPSQYRHIIRAASSIARKNGLPATQFESTIPLKKYGLYPLTYKMDLDIHVVTNIKQLRPPFIVVTSADSDSDFLKYNKDAE